MKQPIGILIAALAVWALAVAAFAETAAASSPDGKNEIRLDTDPVLSYSVRRGGRELFPPAPIALEVEGRAPLGGAGLKVVSKSARALAGMVDTPIYKKSSVSLAGNETSVSFGDWSVTLVARDDGVAYRFETRFGGRATVLSETASVRFPSADTRLCMGENNGIGYENDRYEISWESIYTNTVPARLKDFATTSYYLPFLVDFGDAVACVTESDLRDYPGWSLRRVRNDVMLMGAVFAPLPKRVCNLEYLKGWQDKPARWMRVRERENCIARTEGTRTYPWRTFLLADCVERLCESDIVYALAAPCKIADKSWIRPGKVAWDWWNDWNVSGHPAGFRPVDFKSGCNTETYKYYIDFAHKFGLEYVILDEGWSANLDVFRFNPEVDVPGLVRYAAERGVGIILWCAWPQLADRQEELCAHFAALGVRGLKIDFIDRDDQLAERFIEKTADIAAKHRLVVDYHGMHKPTGMSRTYPNVLNYEGVHGLESCKFRGTEKQDFPRNDVYSFFVRMSAGPMDYTPGAMINQTRAQFVPNYNLPSSQGTRVHQMALMTLYEAPLQMLCDSPTQYLRNSECFSFMAKVPTVWDETRGLAGDRHRYAVAARRKGDVWYAGAICTWEGADIELDTTFLGSGAWQAEVFADGINADRDATDYMRTVRKVLAGEKMKLKLAPGGGWTARFTTCGGK